MRQTTRRPNIVVVLSDDMGLGDLGCFGGNVEPTPQIDALAAESLRLEHFYVSSPICSPSRAALLTGMFPARLRITNYLHDRQGNRESEQADFLDPAATCLPRVLQEHGYATAHIGKWHLGGGRDVDDAPPFSAYGYDEGVGTWESPEPHPAITAGDWIWSDDDEVKRWERTGFFVDRTLDFLQRHGDRPCFVNLWPDDMHDPWVPGPDAPAENSEATFRPVLAEYDRQIGRLLEGLDALGIADDTLLVLASDNGPFPTLRGRRCVGRRGSKWSLYECGIRTPFIARWPGRFPAGATDTTSVVAAIDLLPTLCRAAGAATPAAAIDGEDRLDVLLGTPSERSGLLFWEYGRNRSAFIVPPSPMNASPGLAVREGRWKLLVNGDGSDAELYDIVSDAAEQLDLAHVQRDVVARLSEHVLAWRRSLP